MTRGAVLLVVVLGVVAASHADAKPLSGARAHASAGLARGVDEGEVDELLKGLDDVLAARNHDMEEKKIEVVAQGNDNESDDDNSVIEDSGIIENGNGVIEDDNSVIEDDNSVIEDDNSVVEDNNNVVEDDNSVVEDDNSVVEDDDNVVGEDALFSDSDEDSLGGDDDLLGEDDDLPLNDVGTLGEDSNEGDFDDDDNGNQQRIAPVTPEVAAVGDDDDLFEVGAEYENTAQDEDQDDSDNDDDTRGSARATLAISGVDVDEDDLGDEDGVVGDEVDKEDQVVAVDDEPGVGPGDASPLFDATQPAVVEGAVHADVVDEDDPYIEDRPATGVEQVPAVHSDAVDADDPYIEDRPATGVEQVPPVHAGAVDEDDPYIEDRPATTQHKPRSATRRTATPGGLWSSPYMNQLAMYNPQLFLHAQAMHLMQGSAHSQMPWNPYAMWNPLMMGWGMGLMF